MRGGCDAGCLALLAGGGERLPPLASISKPCRWCRMRPQEPQHEDEPVMSNNFSSRNRIVLTSDTVIIGGTEYALHDVKGVRASVHVPTGFRRWAFVAFCILFSTGVLAAIMLLFVSLSTILPAANLLDLTWVVFVIFFGGVAVSFGTYIYGWRTYPSECRVELDTSTGTHTVYVSQSFIDAQAFRDRLQRKLTAAARS